MRHAIVLLALLGLLIAGQTLASGSLSRLLQGRVDPALLSLPVCSG